MQRLIDCYDMNACSSDEWFVRVGGDDPLVSTEGIELMAKQIKDNRLDKNVAMYYSSYDDGMIYGCAVEIFRANKYKEVPIVSIVLKTIWTTQRIYIKNIQSQHSQINIF